MAEVPRSGRLATLRQLLDQACFTSQAELIEALAVEGITVSQSTLSKDLLELGAVRQRGAGGALVYAMASESTAAATEKLARLCAELLISIRHAGTQILIKTPPGAAQYYASFLDLAALRGVLGTIAGDDTVLVIATDDDSAARVVAEVTEMTKTGKPVKDSREH